MSLSTNQKITFILFSLGFMGILSTLLMPLNLPEGADIPFSDNTIRALGIVQSCVMLALALWAGSTLGRKLGFRAPIIESILNKDFSISQLSQLKSSVVFGFIGGVAVLMFSFFYQSYLPESFLIASEKSMSELNPLVRFMYGGITEELLMRWGLMSLIAWIGSKITGKQSAIAVWFGIVIAALIFGVAHLPAVQGLTNELTSNLVVYIITMNSVLGILFGWLFWKKGIEAAMVAHSFAHVAFLSVAPLLS